MCTFNNSQQTTDKGSKQRDDTVSIYNHSITVKILINENYCTSISELFTDCVHVITPLMKSLLIQIFVTCDFTVETAYLI